MKVPLYRKQYAALVIPVVGDTARQKSPFTCVPAAA